MARIVARLQDFLRLESSAGIILIFAALLAMLASNSVFSDLYGALLSTPVKIQIGGFEIAKPLLLWINDGLMAVFFFLIGLEVKREIVEGELSTFDKAALPFFAAIGGIAAPALIYAAFNWSNPETINGWAIPAATDIAFALGILALFGARAPVSLKIFLLAIAIIDDLGAILIIALFYTENLSLTALSLALIGLVTLFAMNRAGVKKITPYVLITVVMWACVLKSGVHATMAGVLAATMIPMRGKTPESQSPLHKLEHDLHPFIAYFVLPVFAFANAGVALQGLTLEAMTASVPLGIALGLLLGKPIGVMLMAFAAVKTGLAKLPAGLTWMQLFGCACLTGVGFTMSLFIGGLAFDSTDTLNQVRLGVLSGSILSGVVGYAILNWALEPKKSQAPMGATLNKA